MKSERKPSRGCAATGFTFVDPEGSLVQVSWDDMRIRGEALFVLDGSRWRRVRSSGLLPKTDRLLRFAIGPKDASADLLEERSVLLPSEALSGEFAGSVARARMVAALPAVLVSQSNLWNELGPLDREIITLLRRKSMDLSDAALAGFLATGRLGSVTLADYLPDGAAPWSQRAVVSEDVRAKLSDGDLRDLALLADAMAQKTDAVTAGFSPAAESLLGLVANFLDAPNPLCAALHATYEIPDGPRWQMVNATRLLQSLGVDASEAFALAGQLGVDAAPLMLDLVDLHLRRRPGDLDGALSVASEFRADPAEAVRAHGTVLQDMVLRFPGMSTATAGKLVESVGVNMFDPVSSVSDRLLAPFDPDTFAELQRLVPDERLLVDIAGPLLSTFGKRAPEWLLRSATSPEIDRARVLSRLPSADEAVRRRRQLEESLAAPPLSAAQKEARARQAEILSSIASGSSVAAALQAADADTILALFPVAGPLRKRAKQLESAGDEVSAGYAALLRRFDAARTGNDQKAALSLAAEIASIEDLAASLLPSGSQLEREIARAQADALGEDDVRRRESLEQEYELWNAYANAFVESDDAELLRVGALLRPDREPPGGRVSPHDAAYWLPVSPDAATAPDGSGFGDWLLSGDRGVSAIRSDSGRRSLGSAALEWAGSGESRAQIKDLADRAAVRNFGGHDDPVSLFFAKNKVAPESATETLESVRRSSDVPTPFPLDAVFTDDSSGLRGYFLPRTDPRGVQLGVLTDCCQHPSSAGRSCAFMGQEYPSGGFFVVEDADGDIVAQSWVWAGTASGSEVSSAVFDNIEARLSGVSDIRTTGVLSVYEMASAALGERFDLVTVGAKSDVSVDMFPSLDARSAPHLSSVGYRGYSDASEHRVLHKGTPTVRFTGREGGFDIAEGDCKVFVDAQGRVHCADERGVDLARRALASSTPREYEVVWSGGDDLLLLGEPSGVTFKAGTVTAAGWSPDLSAAPESYTKVSETLLTAMRDVGVVDPDMASAYLRAADFDVRRAERLAASGWTPAELERFKQAHHPYVVMPQELRDLDPSDVTRRRFAQLAPTAPLLAQALLHRDIASISGSGAAILPDLDASDFSEVPAAGLVMLANCRDHRLRDCMRAALVGPSASDLGGTIGAGLSSVARHNRSVVVNNLQEAALAAREMADAGLSAKEVGSLHLFRSLSRSEVPPALLDREDRALWASLSAEDRKLAVERISEASEWTGGLRPYSLSSWTSLPADLPQKDVNLLANADPYAPSRALAVVEELTRESGGEGKGLPADADELLRGYRENVRYVRGDLDGMTAQEAVVVASLDLKPLVESLEEIGMRRNFGENMPEFTFTSDSIATVARMDGEVVRSIGRRFVCDDAAPEDIAAIVASGVDVGVFDGVAAQNGSRGVRIRAAEVGRAFRSGVTSEVVTALTGSGASAELVTVALRIPEVRDRLLSESPDLPLLEEVAGWVCEGGGYSWGFGGEMPHEEVNLLLDLAGRSSLDRDSLLAALGSEDGDMVGFRDLLEVLPSSTEVFASLGGVRAATEVYI